jgi:nucleoside-diphosphate kinase
MLERTFVMIKPDGVQRNLVGEIILRLEKKGLKIVALKFLRLTEGMAREHYREHVGKPFFPGLLEYITSGPVVAMAWEGKNAVQEVRKLLGATNPGEALPGTIRGDLGSGYWAECNSWCGFSGKRPERIGPLFPAGRNH